MSKDSFCFDNYDLQGLTSVIAEFGCERFGYVVTPNADHLIRLHDDASLRAAYAEASYITLDSRFLSYVLRLVKGMSLPVCTGSDLTGKLFAEVIRPDDQLVVIGSSTDQVLQLTAKFGLGRIAHHNPPMGFIHDALAVETCLRFIENHSPFRYCVLAIGSPQQEIIAQRLRSRGKARGMALCVGASINFLTGAERRAPRWMQRLGIEWLFRLMQDPRRMANRYLVRGPRVFGLLGYAEITLRSRPAALPSPPVVGNRAAA